MSESPKSITEQSTYLCQWFCGSSEGEDVVSTSVFSLDAAVWAPASKAQIQRRRSCHAELADGMEGHTSSRNCSDVPTPKEFGARCLPMPQATMPCSQPERGMSMGRYWHRRRRAPAFMDVWMEGWLDRGRRYMKSITTAIGDGTGSRACAEECTCDGNG